MFVIFGVTMLTALLLAVPLWVFFVPLLILISACIKFRYRTRIRTACTILALLIALLALPFAAVQGYYRMQADERLESQFGVPVGPAVVTRYRFEPGFLDSLEYWKLKRLDPNTCRQIVSKNSLTRIDPEGPRLPGGFAGSPSWWPKSMDDFSVFYGEDRFGGNKEIWISADESVAYLFCFLE